MEQKIKDRFNDSILIEAMRRYGIGVDQIRPLDAFESYIYEFERGKEAYILRIGHSLRRTEALIQGEVDWINYLAEGGATVAKAILSESGKLVEAIDDGQGGQFLATAFVKAQGVPPWDAGYTPVLYESYGKLIGRMHALSREYRPPHAACRRPEWDDETMDYVHNYLPVDEIIAKQKYEAVRDHVNTLPKDKPSYGLIHQDAHGNNYFVDEAGNLTMFDFDECVYSWYINDIAIILFYIVMDAEDWPAFTQEFLTHFLRGYQQENQLDPKWLKEIPYFLKIREIELYAVVFRDFDVNHIDHWWIARFMNNRKAKIEQDIPFIQFDFESLSSILD